MDIITFENVGFEYSRFDEESGQVKRTVALKDVSCAVKKGEFLAVLGHNGSGKSTFAKLINALLLPTAGTVTVNGLNTSDEENVYKARKSAGMVFQNPDNQIIASIVEEDVAFGPENLGMESEVIVQRVAAALETVGMSEYADVPTHVLSGGQKQRLAIAGVLAMEPDIIVMDEPTAMLDPVGRKDVLKTARTLNREKGITVVLITHFMDEAISAGRVMVMENGSIVMDGAPADVFSDPARMKALGLDMPQIADLNFRLRGAGHNLPEGILTIKEMTDALCRLKQGM
jgi:energy-coupling factor transport system ATP-binding protein